MVDHVLQRTSGELYTLQFDLPEGLLDVHFGVLVGDGVRWIVKHTPPDVLKVRPHSLDRVELRSGCWNEHQFDA